MMTQTLALLLDAYRDLSARKLFWIVLAISTLLAASFAGVGVNPDGISLFGKTFQSYLFNSDMIAPATFYKLIFIHAGVNWWLSFLATGLALISTAGIFPDFIAGGAIDLYLSRPISRLRLFFTKYLCGLLFVTLQITCFCLACMLVIGIRSGAWMPAIFIAVPLVLAFYSYLYCFCVLMGILTRSGIAALLLTGLFWGGVFAVHATETGLLTMQIAQQREIAAGNATYNSFTRPHDYVYAAMTVLPKTSETIDMLQRELLRRTELPPEWNDSENRSGPIRSSDVATLREDLRSRSPWWVIGTSLVFEAVILAVAAWVFCRRDY